MQSRAIDSLVGIRRLTRTGKTFNGSPFLLFMFVFALPLEFLFDLLFVCSSICSSCALVWFSFLFDLLFVPHRSTLCCSRSVRRCFHSICSSLPNQTLDYLIRSDSIAYLIDWLLVCSLIFSTSSLAITGSPPPTQLCFSSKVNYISLYSRLRSLCNQCFGRACIYYALLKAGLAGSQESPLISDLQTRGDDLGFAKWFEGFQGRSGYKWKLHFGLTPVGGWCMHFLIPVEPLWMVLLPAYALLVLCKFFYCVCKSTIRNIENRIPYEA